MTDWPITAFTWINILSGITLMVTGLLAARRFGRDAALAILVWGLVPAMANAYPSDEVALAFVKATANVVVILSAVFLLRHARKHVDAGRRSATLTTASIVLLGLVPVVVVLAVIGKDTAAGLVADAGFFLGLALALGLLAAWKAWRDASGWLLVTGVCFGLAYSIGFSLAYAVHDWSDPVLGTILAASYLVLVLVVPALLYRHAPQDARRRLALLIPAVAALAWLRIPASGWFFAALAPGLPRILAATIFLWPALRTTAEEQFVPMAGLRVVFYGSLVAVAALTLANNLPGLEVLEPIGAALAIVVVAVLIFLACRGWARPTSSTVAIGSAAAKA